jgi:rfaE bifunctional protein nucleotidyltransferase chain/domain
MELKPKTNLEIIRAKLLDAEALRHRVLFWRFKSEKIVFTNGCFDLLHQGHIDYLSKAADCGTQLIVGVNSDASVKRLGKGGSRPLQDQFSRAMLIASLHFVAAVIIFDEDTPRELIEAIQPDVLVKGSDWEIEKIVGHDIVQARGGQVKRIDFLPGFSTTSIEQKIKNS